MPSWRSAYLVKHRDNFTLYSGNGNGIEDKLPQDISTKYAIPINNSVSLWADKDYKH
jgi:hypothetical protein